MLELAAGCGILKVGGVTVAIDGTKVLDNANKHSAVSHGHAPTSPREIESEIAPLLTKAERADATPLQDSLTVAGATTEITYLIIFPVFSGFFALGLESESPLQKKLKKWLTETG